MIVRFWFLLSYLITTVLKIENWKVFQSRCVFFIDSTFFLNVALRLGPCRSYTKRNEVVFFTRHPDSVTVSLTKAGTMGEIFKFWPKVMRIRTVMSSSEYDRSQFFDIRPKHWSRLFHILIDVENWNCLWTLDVYLFFLTFPACF